MKETIYMTLKVYNFGISSLIYIADYLGIALGDVVRLTFYKLGDPDKNTQTLVKRVVKIGNAHGCYIDKKCGINKGDIVVVRIEPMESDTSDDTRIETQKGFEDPFE